ncbi:DUF402 domain-containing protein [Actinopolymorpha pittospori]
MQDTGDLLALARWPGVEGLAPTTWIEWLHTGDDVARQRALPNLARGHWDLATWRWRDTTVLTLLLPDTYFSVDLFFGDRGELAMWYVNFEQPYRRTALGIDTFDLLLDLVVAPDLRPRWKDEDEYHQGRRLGLITDTEHRQVQVAREQVMDLLRRAEGPFDRRWQDWRRESSWERPVLPPEVLTVAED